MSNYSTSDTSSLRIHLNELRSDFDRCMREGDNFECVKKIYMEIKALECQLNVMDWEMESRTRTYTPLGHSFRDENATPLL